MFDVVAELGKGGQGIIADGLAASKAELAEEASTSTGYVFNDDAFDVYLELKKIHVLPIRAIKCKYIPCSRNLEIKSRKNIFIVHKKAISYAVMPLPLSISPCLLLHISHCDLDTIETIHSD